MMEPPESEGLTESVTVQSAEEIPIMRDQPVKKPRRVAKLKNRVNDKVTNQKVVKSKASTDVMTLGKVSRPNEVREGDGATHSGRLKENQMPPMLIAGLISAASKVRKNKRTFGLHQIGNGGHQPMWIRWIRRHIMAKIKLMGQLDVVEYSRITVPELVHMSDPATGGYVEMVKARNSARGHLMA